MDPAVVRALAEARALGFLGPGPLEAHADSAMAFVAALRDVDGDGLDLGSGGGVPGLLLAAHYTDVRWTLLDANRRRTSFLARAVAELGWSGRVAVRRAQAEVAAHEPALRGAFAVVVARSFGPPAQTAECAAGFLRVGGRLAVAEPPDASGERWDGAKLGERLGLAVEQAGRVIVMRAVAPAPGDVPRPLRTMQRSPLWA